MPVDVKPILVLAGPDPFIQVQKLHEIQTKLSGALRTDFDGESATLAEVLDEVRQVSMFSTSKLVVVRDAEEFFDKYRDQLERFVHRVADQTEKLTGTLVFRVGSFDSRTKLYKAVSEAGQVIKCDPPAEDELPEWILRQARDVHRVEIARPAAAELANLVGNDLGRLDSELGRLALLLPDPPAPQVITAELVESSVKFGREQEVREVVALLARGRVQQALVQWRLLLETDPAAEFKAATWLMIWLEQAWKAADPPAKGEAIASIGRTFWIVDRAHLSEGLDVARQLGRAGIADLMARLTEVDRRIKTGLGDAARLIERFMATALPGKAAASPGRAAALPGRAASAAEPGPSFAASTGLKLPHAQGRTSAHRRHPDGLHR